jgi:colanic acid/amylovoran biosynthesis glycosyltransferase
MFMKLCYTRSNKYSHSETFLDNQIKILQPEIVIYEGWYPSILPNDKSFLPFPFNYLVIRGGLRNILPKIYHVLYTRFLASYLVKNNIDVLLANYGPMGVALSDACERAKVKIVVHFYGFDATETKILAVYKEKYSVLFQKVAAIVVVSNDMKEQLHKLGADLSKIHVIPCGVNTSQFAGASPETKPPVFITMGRFTAKKSPQNTIRAFAEVVKKVPDAQLIMIGDGELWEESKQLANELGVIDSIEFKGRKSPQEALGLMHQARVFLQHSMFAPNGDSEGTPVAILEASATGLPIVSTRHAGIKEAVVHGETGFLVEEGDWKKMGEYMIQLAQNPVLCGQMGKNARKHMEEKYEMSKLLNDLKSVLNI